jgi:hypothetical protein
MPVRTGGEVERAPVLSVTCPKCFLTFASEIQTDPSTWERIDVVGIVERCRSCSAVSMFEKSAYRFVDPE